MRRQCDGASRQGRAGLQPPRPTQLVGAYIACGALYGFPEDLLMEGVTPFHPLDVLDAALTAWRDKAFQLNTWTV